MAGLVLIAASAAYWTGVRSKPASSTSARNTATAICWKRRAKCPGISLLSLLSLTELSRAGQELTSVLIISMLINIEDRRRSHAVSPERIRAGRPRNRRSCRAGFGLRHIRIDPRGSRCADRRLRTGGLDAGGAAFGVSRYQDLHRGAEAEPAAARPGRRRRLPHHGDVPRLLLQRACAEGGVLGQ